MEAYLHARYPRTMRLTYDQISNHEDTPIDVTSSIIGDEITD